MFLEEHKKSQECSQVHNLISAYVDIQSAVKRVADIKWRHA